MWWFDFVGIVFGSLVVGCECCIVVVLKENVCVMWVFCYLLIGYGGCVV